MRVWPRHFFISRDGVSSETGKSPVGVKNPDRNRTNSNKVCPLSRRKNDHLSCSKTLNLKKVTIEGKINFQALEIDSSRRWFRSQFVASGLVYMPPAAIARVIAFAIGQPADVDADEPNALG